MKTACYILIYMMSLTTMEVFGQIPTQPQPVSPTQSQPTNPTQPQTNPTQQQTNPTQQQTTNPTIPTSMGIPTVTDPATTQKLQSDFQSQGTGLTNQPVNWYNNSANGYIGTTSYNNSNYLIQYDSQGNFQQTFVFNRPSYSRIGIAQMFLTT